MRLDGDFSFWVKMFIAPAALVVLALVWSLFFGTIIIVTVALAGFLFVQEIGDGWRPWRRIWSRL